MNTPATFSPASLQDKVQERIRASFVNLIPEDAWKVMVEREISYFTSPSRRGDELVTPIGLMIRAEIQERLKEKLKAHLDVVVQMEWDNNLQVHVPSAFSREIAASMAPLMVQHMFAGIVHNAVELMKHEMRRS
jgi:hypothetical protein